MDNEELNKLSVAELAEKIAYHNRLYWENNAPEISDADYDKLIEALRRLDPEHPLLKQVNAVSVAGGGKVRHRELMLSLDKAYSLAEVLEWAGKFCRSGAEKLLIQPKYDGISVNFDGEILSTRGDGIEGEDVSDKIPLIELELPQYTGKLDRPARGELLIRQDDFADIYSHIRKKDGGFYKNPRNAVAGIMGLKNTDFLLLQGAKLTLADYSLVSFEVEYSALEQRWEELKAQLAELPYPMDGIVIKLSDAAYRDSLGNTAHHPRGAIAYKFTNLSAVTILEDVEWSFGKNSLTPVAHLRPVELSGITIKRATLHNAQNLLDLGVMIGDSVTVERAGDVIPYIASCTPNPDEKARRTPFIDHCPACGSILERRGPEICCLSPDCPETCLQRLLAAVRSLGIERLGEPTLRKLVEKFSIRHLSELFSLRSGNFMVLEGFKEKSASNLYNEIQKARQVPDYRVLASLNIAHVGLNMAKVLLTDYTLDELRHLSVDELSGIAGIGPERAGALHRSFEERAGELDELLAAVELRHGENAPGGKTICFTGKMPEKRKYYEDLAAQAGFRAVDQVTSELDLLVAADLSSGSSKLKNAEKYGVKIMDLSAFLSEYSAGGAVDKMPEDGNGAPLSEEPSGQLTLF